MIYDRLSEELERARRYRYPLSVVLCDLDHFKEVNDTFGHLAGDAVLREGAAVLRRCLRSTDILGRYGGEEFLAVLPQVDLESARLAAERLRLGLEGVRVRLPTGGEVRITASFGVASRDDLPGLLTTDLLGVAGGPPALRGQGGRPELHPPMNTPQAEESPVLRLVSLIRETTGNVIPPARTAFLEEVAERRAHSRGLAGVEEYVRALAARELADEWESLIPLVTIKESYFFRAPQQFDVIRQRLLPELVKARAASRQLRIWSAACARGEEPATLAMLLAEEPALAGWDWSIVATDVDEEALAGARLGLYGERAVSQVPLEQLEHWFSRRGKLYELDLNLRSRIVYQRLNLAHAPFALPYEQFDLVLMRNVLIYFRRPLQRWVISQVARVLTPEGYLFLGASETLWQIQDELESVDLGPCFAYRHRGARPVGGEGLEPPAKRPRVAGRCRRWPKSLLHRPGPSRPSPRHRRHPNPERLSPLRCRLSPWPRRRRKPPLASTSCF